MNLNLQDCTLTGTALSEPFFRYELGPQLSRLGLLSAQHGQAFEREWDALRRRFRSGGSPQSVCRNTIGPLAERLGYEPPVRQAEVATREGLEDGGLLMQTQAGARLRAWSFSGGADLDAPHRTGRAYRSSPMRTAQRVLLAESERIGLLTDGEEMRVLICDPALSSGLISIPIAGNGWRAQNQAPDSYRLVLALASPNGIAVLPELLEAARLNQTRVTDDLRWQAHRAIEGFLQALLENNASRKDVLLQAKTLWEEALIVTYRLLFILKLESSPDPACAFSFASTSLWRTTLSPNRALGPLVRRHLDQNHDTGNMLEDGLRTVFRIFQDGLCCSELSVHPLGGALFGAQSTPLLDGLAWGERATALLLDRLLWTTPKGRARERVHYGSLDVEDLGHVYEALLELEPGITTAPMSRLRRGKLEAVVPIEQAMAYRKAARAGSGTRVLWVEDIPAGQFFLQTGLGRKTSGSYYTPHAFVSFLVREALAPEIARRSPDTDPDPAAILAFKVVDPAAGSGHFLVEACRYLAEALYAACRGCDETADALEDQAASALPQDRAPLLARSAMLRQRLANLPDPDGLLLSYLPSRASEGGATGISQSRALGICRRLVAVHCLYGVDSNRLSVELAKLSLWLESYAKDLPLTFLDHRLVVGDSIGGPFLSSLMTLPVSKKQLDPLLAHDVSRLLDDAQHKALREVVALQATVGGDVADIAAKAAAKQRLDTTLHPLRLLARAWSGAVMLALREGDDEWLALARGLAKTGEWPDALTERQSAMLAAGSSTFPWDVMFPEVFYCEESGRTRGGFDAVLSNPPWDIMQPNTAEFFAEFDLSALDAPSPQHGRHIRGRLLVDPTIARALDAYRQTFSHQQRLVQRHYKHQRFGVDGAVMGGKLDLYRVFAERMMQIAGDCGAIGMVVPSAFHANEGATAIRKLYLRESKIEWCLSFENRHRLFDIHGRYKFALVVARLPGPTADVRCGFYLNEFRQLEEPERLLQYDSDFIRLSGGAHATLLELRDAADLPLARRMFQSSLRFAPWFERNKITLSREIHMSDDAGKFVSLAGPKNRVQHEAVAATGPRRPGRDHYLLHEGKTIHQFSDTWDTAPRYAIRAEDLRQKPLSADALRYYRAACREIARSTDERTSIATIVPPRVLCGHTINVERRPARRPNTAALVLVGIMNSFAFDWILRQKVAVHVSLYILSELPMPTLCADAERMLAHGVLRLCCNHRGFADLWHEQLGEVWREAAPKRFWPAIATEAERWRLRAYLDAIVAHSYGLMRVQYERVLACFSHKSFPPAPDVCLAAFDEIERSDLASFCRVHDPYGDIPLVTALARAVVPLRDPTAMKQGLLPGVTPRAG